MFKISLLDVNVIETQKYCDYFDQGYVYTEEIYPELFNNPSAKITMVGKIDISILQDLVKENNLINTLYWY